ncbi:MAG TPA: hypothetical protein VGK87_13415 [Anaerolineae bacterium]
MKDIVSIQKSSNQNALSGLFSVIRKKYPNVSDEQVEHLQNKVINYVSDGLNDGYDLALIKRKDGKTVLKILKLMEEEDR